MQSTEKADNFFFFFKTIILSYNICNTIFILGFACFVM